MTIVWSASTATVRANAVTLLSAADIVHLFSGTRKPTAAAATSSRRAFTRPVLLINRRHPRAAHAHPMALHCWYSRMPDVHRRTQCMHAHDVPLSVCMHVLMSWCRCISKSVCLRRRWAVGLCGSPSFRRRTRFQIRPRQERPITGVYSRVLTCVSCSTRVGLAMDYRYLVS